MNKIIPNFIKNIFYHLPKAFLANLFYGFPSRHLKVIAVTGTDGKTTTVNMIYKILKDSGKQVSMISTIYAEIAGRKYTSGLHVTTPDPFKIQRYIKQAADTGDEYFILEVSSHALDQYRVWGINFQIGVVTNVTHEHLDYHQTFSNYLKAKSKLITSAKYAVINYDDPSFGKLKKSASGKVLSFGLTKEADINPITYPLSLKLPGDYNILNGLAAVAVAKILEIDLTKSANSLEQFSFPPMSGRIEEIENDRGVKIFVDFAHTPNGIESVLKTLRAITKGRLIAVFGSASERDISKRPIMGKMAARFADVIILTDDEPRFEDRDKIIDEIAVGALVEGAVEGKTLFREHDRREALKMALRIAQKGDTIAALGKGHENTINYHGVDTAWSDQKVIRSLLKA